MDVGKLLVVYAVNLESSNLSCRFRDNSLRICSDLASGRQEDN